MSDEEVKGEHQSIKARPKVGTMKACIVSMEYDIKRTDGKKEVDTIRESYADAEKMKLLLMNTLGWDSDDVSTF
jgi:hypothetical protein